MLESLNIDNLPEALALLRAAATWIQNERESLNCLAEYGEPCLNSGRSCACGRVWHPDTDDVEPGNISERCRERNQRLAPQAKDECAICKHTRIAEEALAWLDSLGGEDLPGSPRPLLTSPRL
jgi:hypothetical protein